MLIENLPLSEYYQILKKEQLSQCSQKTHWPTIRTNKKIQQADQSHNQQVKPQPFPDTGNNQ